MGGALVGRVYWVVVWPGICIVGGNMCMALAMRV